MKDKWVEDFIRSDEDLHIGNFRGTDNLIMISPMGGNTNWYLTNSRQKFELSESKKRLYIVDYSNKELPRIVRKFNMKSIVTFGYTK